MGMNSMANYLSNIHLSFSFSSGIVFLIENQIATQTNIIKYPIVKIFSSIKTPFKIMEPSMGFEPTWNRIRSSVLIR